MKELFMNLNYFSIIIRLLLAVLVGGIIGSERARHGRDAGMRTHILVCVGAAMTAMTGIYVSTTLNMGGDASRIAAQVVSGIGFLGAGMILIKNNSVITGLTTAAGMWTAAAIGIAAGYGFYIGVLVSTVLCLLTTALLSRFEKKPKFFEKIYIEIDDMYHTNEILRQIEGMSKKKFECHVTPSKSGAAGHIGIELLTKQTEKPDVESIKEINNVVFVIED